MVLAFPCNQFAKQEKGGAEEIGAYVAGLGVTYPVMTKVPFCFLCVCSCIGTEVDDWGWGGVARSSGRPLLGVTAAVVALAGEPPYVVRTHMPTHSFTIL